MNHAAVALGAVSASRASSCTSKAVVLMLVVLVAAAVLVVLVVLVPQLCHDARNHALADVRSSRRSGSFELSMVLLCRAKCPGYVAQEMSMKMCPSLSPEEKGSVFVKKVS